jgi:DNA-binding NtrC family response regulator
VARIGIDVAKLPILVVDDEPDNLAAFRFNFGKAFSLDLAGDPETALAIARAKDVAVVVTDQRMPRMTGLELLRELAVIRPDAVGIIVTAYTDTQVLVEAINLGRIYRYVTKPWDGKEMRGILVQAAERFHLLRENRRLVEQIEQYAGVLSRDAHGEFNFGEIVGKSPLLLEVLGKVEQVAQTASTVLLRGETGTGKEMVARAIHINSPREARPFVRVACAALSQGVLESELFGHEKGAFTGAMSRRPGRFELANGGTLFLDEIGDLPPEVQVKLLRVLQEREFERVGGVETVKVDVRVISATHRDLERMVAERKFREDLYYRLAVFPVSLPPLRARPGDVALLCDHFIQKLAQATGKWVRGADAEALAILSAYPWPGNVRELENVIERAMILARGTVLTAADLDFGRRPAPSQGTNGVDVRAGEGAPPDDAAGRAGSGGAPGAADGGGAAAGAAVASPSGGEPGRSLQRRLWEQERAEIVAAVERTQGNIAHAARALGINRSTLYYRMRKHGLEHLLPARDVGARELPESGAGTESGGQSGIQAGAHADKGS